MFWKRHKDLIIIGVIWIAFSSVALILLCPKTYEQIQAEALITLVFVTIFYAKQTKGLVKEQKLERDLRFNERRLQSFYNPFIEHLYEVFDVFEKIKIREIRDILETPRKEICWPHYFMLQNETREMVSNFFKELIEKAMDEGTDLAKEDAGSELRKSFNKMRKKLEEEREKIENYISDNYPFPEKEIENRR